MFVVYLDNYSGGGSCTDYDRIIIEVDASNWEEAEDKAEVIFEKKFNVSPYGCSCECCGSDYSIFTLDGKEELEEIIRENSYPTIIVWKDGRTEIKG